MLTTIADRVNVYSKMKSELKNSEFEASYGHLKFEISVGDAREALQDMINGQPRQN